MTAESLQEYPSRSRRRWTWVVTTLAALMGLAASGCESRVSPTPTTTPAAPLESAVGAPLPETGANRESAADSDPTAGGEPAKANAEPATASGERPIELKLLDYEGIQQLIASHRGKVVVMDAWSTSCLPCVREFPRLVELQQRFGRSDVACVSLSFDYEGLGKPEEEAERVLKFLTARKASFDNVLSRDAADELYRRLHLAAIPAVFVYDRQGQLRKRFDNEAARSSAEAFTYDQVNELVAELVREAP